MIIILQIISKFNVTKISYKISYLVFLSPTCDY
jgi:hypothetical protein